MTKWLGHYFVSLASESGICSCTWTNVRQSEINSVACFRYTLPMSFIYLTNESLSKLGFCPGAVTEGAEGEVLRDMRLDNGKPG